MTIQLGRQGLLWKWSSFERELRHLSDDVFEVPNVGHRDHDLVFVVLSGKVVAARLFDIEFSRSP
jgi:hypothetical protein